MRDIFTLQLLFLFALLVPWSSASAQWELDNDNSSINFISIKNDAIGEMHSFESLVGFVGEDGSVQVGIDLDSVQTLIEIRNERMRKMLFETAKFPAANVTATVEPSLIAAAAEGGTVNADVTAFLSLHGVEGNVSIPVVVIGDGSGQLRVFTARPVLLNAADFGLEEGIKALREIAGLRAISNVVPVTMHLVFNPAK